MALTIPLINKRYLALTITLVSVGTLLSFVHMKADAAAPDAQSSAGQLLPSQSYNEYMRLRRLEQNPQDQQQKFDFGQQQAQIGLQETSFFVNDIQFEGNTLVDSASLNSLAMGYKNKQTNLDELTKLVEDVNKLYWDKGYLTSQAVIPPQDVSYGALKIQVYEGRLGKVGLEGNRFTRSGTIMNQLDLKEGEIINFRDLEENLNRMNVQNRYAVKASLEPGSQTGETDVTLKVEDPNPWQVTPTFDNQGRPFIGYYRTGVQVANYNVSGRGDRASVSASRSEGSTTVLGQYVTPIGKYGTEVGVLGGYSNVDLRGLPGVPDGFITGDAYNASLFAQQPLDKKRRWLVDGALNGKRIESEAGSVRTNVDDIRSGALGVSFNDFDRWGRTNARVAGTMGVAALGGNRAFSKVEGYATRLFTLPSDNLLILRASGQYAPTDLPSAEGYAVGGAYSVRGYTEGTLVGDSGYTLSAEHRWPIPGLRHISPWWHDRLRGVFFIDAGQSFLDSNTLRAFNDGKRNQFIAGAGAGLRLSLSQYLTGFLDVGFPLVNPDSVESVSVGGPTARIHFGVRSDLVNAGQYEKGIRKD